jgi:hypothetical protein
VSPVEVVLNAGRPRPKPRLQAWGHPSSLLPDHVQGGGWALEEGKGGMR